MSIITIPTAFNIDLEFKVAAFHKRLLAWFVDILIMYAFIYVMRRFVVPEMEDNMIGNILSIICVFLPAYSYHLLMELFCNGRSVGKMAMGIKVMDISGREASFSQYLLRWVFRIVDMGVTMGAGCVLSIALTAHNQRLGDLVAGTIVIDQRGQTGLNETIYLDIEEKDYKVMFPQVMRLTDRDINGIRGLLNMKVGDKDNNTYMAQVAGRIKEVLEIEAEAEPREFLHRLLSDYNYLSQK